MKLPVKVVERVSPSVEEPKTRIVKTKDVAVAYDEQGRPIYGYNDRGIPVCYSRKGKHPGKRCMNDKRMQSGRCRNHGGKALKGIFHPRYKGGSSRYKKIPEQYARMIQDYEDDPDYISMRSDMGFTAARLNKLAEKMEEGIDLATLKRLQSIAGEMLNATEIGGETELATLRTCARKV